jgi:hypothetical protein
MISERRFAHSYTSFWNQVLPRVDSYLRRVNCAYERYDEEIPCRISGHQDRHGIVNELGFRLFAESTTCGPIADDRVKVLAENVRQYVERLSDATDGVAKEMVNEQEIKESMAIAGSLSHYFKNTPASELVFSPQFPGCGTLHSVKADILHGTELFEVKAGDRSFRVTDIRQVLVYCCLDFASKRYGVKTVVLLNPRRGTYFRTTVSDLVKECSGTTAVDFLSSVIEFVSTELNSR